MFKKIVSAELHDMNRTMIVKGCQTTCIESIVNVTSNLTLTTECCHENLCNLFSRFTTETGNQAYDDDYKNENRTPIELVRLDPIDWLVWPTSLANETTKSSKVNSSSGSNSKDRLIITADNSATTRFSTRLSSSFGFLSNLELLFYITFFILLI